MLRVNSPVVDTIHPKSTKFVMGVKIKATGESKLNDSPAFYFSASPDFYPVLMDNTGDH